MMTSRQQLLLEIETARLRHAWAKAELKAWRTSLGTGEVPERIPFRNCGLSRSLVPPRKQPGVNRPRHRPRRDDRAVGAESRPNHRTLS